MSVSRVLRCPVVIFFFMHLLVFQVALAQPNWDNLILQSIQHNKILLIDDAVGSGATINQIAKKIKNKNAAVSIIGLAIVGSFKGFDVITDV